MLLKERIDTFLGREVSIEARTLKGIYQQMKMSPYIYEKKVDAYIAVSKRSAINQYVGQLSQALEQMITNGELKQMLLKP